LIKNPKVLILTAHYGNGHVQVAKTLEQTFRQKGIEDVIVCDLFGESHPFITDITKYLYLKSYTIGKELYRLFYYGVEKIYDKKIASWYANFGRKRLKTLLQVEKPDIVINTFPIIAVPELKKQTGISIPVYNVLTDFCVHKIWIHREVDRYFVATDPKKVHSNGTKESITRMGIMGLLRESFYEAQHYGHEADFRMLPILKALRREIPVRIHAHRADDISSALRFATEFNLDLRIEHCTEGHFLVEELSKHNLKVSVGPTLTRRSKIELKNKTWDTYHILSKNGVEVSITTDHPYTPIQYLNICAAVAVREGLDEKTALEGITIFPARNLRLEDRIGSIEVGKDADLVLWTHHPFHYLAKPVLTMIDGKIIYKKNKKN